LLHVSGIVKPGGQKRDLEILLAQLRSFADLFTCFNDFQSVLIVVVNRPGREFFMEQSSDKLRSGCEDF
jgi:hypothetical protein